VRTVVVGELLKLQRLSVYNVHGDPEAFKQEHAKLKADQHETDQSGLSSLIIIIYRHLTRSELSLHDGYETFVHQGAPEKIEACLTQSRSNLYKSL
jgi:hypothetical protein